MSIFDGLDFSRPIAHDYLFYPWDFDRSVGAIRFLVEQVRAVEARRAAEIASLEEVQESAADAVDHDGLHGHLNEIHHQSVYEDVVLGHSVVGALTPFFESLFKFGLPRLWEAVPGATRDRLRMNTSPRWSLAPAKQLDPEHFVQPGKNATRGFARGVIQILEALEVRTCFPANLDRVLEAIFVFRNAAFHNGFEWPLKERQDFAQRVQERGWTTWFVRTNERTPQGEQPFMFYLSDPFVDLCVETADQCVVGFSGACTALNVSTIQPRRPRSESC